MPEIYEGKLDAKGLRIAIVASRFNELVVKSLLEGSLDELKRHGVLEEDIDIIRVPGSFEIPFGVKRSAQSGTYDAVIAIGAIIRGETSHFEHLSSTVTSELARISLDLDVPVTSAVITTETVQQAIERAGVKISNRGGEAALSAIEMANLAKVLTGEK